MYRFTARRIFLLLLVGLLLAAGWPLQAVQPVNGAALSSTSLSSTEGQPSPVQPNSGPGINVLTRSYTNSRLGLNNQETLLNTSNVASATFGKLFSRAVDGQIYAQPLYVSNLALPGLGTRNVVLVATQHNSVYAFDADDPAASVPLWQVNLGPSAPTPNPDFGNRYGAYHDINPEVGITSTPVIDLSTNTIYVVAFIKKSGGYQHRLHALNLLTGQDKAGSPKIIAGAVPGTGIDGNIDGNPNLVTFDSKQQLQRVSLLLSNNTIYFAFAGYADTDPYHGWVMAYDKTSLQQTGIFNTTPNGGPPETNGGEGGIWMSGQGIAEDGLGKLYLVVGNGSVTSNTGGRDYGNSILKLGHSTSITIESWFTPWNFNNLNAADADLGVGGILLLPIVRPDGKKMSLSGSKEGKIYITDRDNMGGFCAACNATLGDTNVLQWFQGTSSTHIHGSPVYWDGPATGPTIYVWGENDKLKAYRYDTNTNLFITTPSSQSMMSPPNGMPGGVLTVSANGSTVNSGVVWASMPLVGNANPTTRPGILRAFDAANVATELWNSEQVAARDSLGYLAKFNPPMVANGKVYVGTFSNQLIAYGLLRSVVTKNNDDGSYGSLSYALQNVTSSEVIQFRLTGSSTISETTSLNVPPGIRISGSCSASGPGITINGAGAAAGTDGLILTNNNLIYGLQIAQFTGKQIKTGSGGGNQLSCVKASKT